MSEPALVSSGDHLEDLARAVSGVKGPFCCGGSVDIAAPVRVQLGGTGAEAKVTFEVAPSKQGPGSQEKDAATLVNACQKAPFGHGSQTTYNTSVRDALQLKADSFKLENFDPEASGILSAAKQHLLPSDPDDVIAELYALNVYKPYGHFKTHKDTPRGADMFGTLVVCLPTCFSGGRFVVQHKSIEKAFNWRVGSETPATHLQWCAFFGDCDHRIEPVHSGARVTLTYLLRHSKPQPDAAPNRPVEAVAPAQESEASNIRAVCTALEASLADPSFMSEGGILGFPCFHMYSNEVFPPGGDSSMPLTLKQARKLKGTDAEVALCALSAADGGLNIRVQPFLVEDCADDIWELGRFPTRMMKRRVDPDTIDGMGAEESVEEVEWVLDTPSPSSSANIVKKGMPLNPHPDRPPLMTIGNQCEYSATGYFGNEASCASFYVWAGLLVMVPAAGQGVRAALQAAAPGERAAALEKWAKDANKHRAALGQVRSNAGAAGGAQAASGPAPKKAKTAKQVRDEELMKPQRRILVRGAHGSVTRVGNGEGTIILTPGEGLRELKTKIRQEFGKADYQTLTTLTKCDAPGGVAIKSDELVDGAAVMCHYRVAVGNPGNLFGGGRSTMFFPFGGRRGRMGLFPFDF